MAERDYTETGIVTQDDTLRPPGATHRSVDDIVTRLRLMAGQVPGITYHDLPPASTLADAADEIERLRLAGDIVRDVALALDVPVWLVASQRKPHCFRVRWAFRRITGYRGANCG